MRIEIGLRHLSGADHPGRKMPSHCAVDARAESDIPQKRAIVRAHAKNAFHVARFDECSEDKENAKRRRPAFSFCIRTRLTSVKARRRISG